MNIVMSSFFVDLKALLWYFDNTEIFAANKKEKDWPRASERRESKMQVSVVLCSMITFFLRSQGKLHFNMSSRKKRHRILEPLFNIRLREDDSKSECYDIQTTVSFFVFFQPSILVHCFEIRMSFITIKVNVLHKFRQNNCGDNFFYVTWCSPIKIQSE